MAVDAVHGEGVDERREFVVRKIGAEPAGECKRVARVDAVTGEAKAELGAFQTKHPQVEGRVVRDEEGVHADEFEELAHRLLRGDAVFGEEFVRQPVDGLRPRVHRTGRPDVERQCPGERPTDVLGGGDLADFVAGGSARRLGVEDDDAAGVDASGEKGEGGGGYSQGVGILHVKRAEIANGYAVGEVEVVPVVDDGG